eukprot:CAMPEP_0115099466 /NCGR_PEP_ID=MMETSP0227-20121206/31861_1 /TAXON_ID=89957 /ORGANISM="Polarella glacialis, Strain CCMP 1383" /LENGTH=87 /DNA_ID=CAMNT_0002494447 /DNA_START=85 /DNA_END=348 /DNA_ORIENTATION=+
MSAGMFPTSAPGMHGPPPKTGLVMWQPTPGVRLMRLDLQGEQAPGPSGGMSGSLCALDDAKDAVSKGRAQLSETAPCQLLAGPRRRA